DAIHDIREREGSFLLRHACVIDGLQQQITELFLEVDPVAALDRIGDLVSFLDRIGRDALEGLLEVPRTSRARRPQRRHHGKEIGNGMARAGFVGRSHRRFLIARYMRSMTSARSTGASGVAAASAGSISSALSTVV